MEFTRMSYLITIVESNFNLSAAAKKLLVSQSALSKAINKLENDLNQNIFIRQKGRLVGLTQSGQTLYESALDIQTIYDKTMLEINQAAACQSNLRVGINPLFLSAVCTPTIIQLMDKNPNIKFELVEKSDIDNQELLNKQELDFAFLVHPNMLNSKLFEETPVYRDQLSLFLDKNRPLAREKKLVSWKDLDNLNVAIANNNFTIHHQTMQTFADHQIRPNIMIQGATSAYLIQAVTQTDVVTILPKLLKSSIVSDDIVTLDFEEPIEWIVSMVYPKKKHRAPAENYFIEEIHSFFQENKDPHYLVP